MSIRKGTTIIAGNSSPLDWTGTLQEYNIALENGTIKENMVCYVTDDTLYTDDIRPEIETLNSVKANKDLSNLSEVGEKHFLNKSQITNCITEVPQRVKYTLVDGTLTLLKGSVVIVPYGLEDKTEEFPVGSVFINDNFKVYDTQFANGKFFVWAELVNDIVYSQAWQTAEGGLASVVMDNRFLGATYNRHHSGDTSSIQTSGISFLYDLTANKITRYVSKVMDGEYCSFPVMETVSIISNTPTIGVINQVFNGMGYIGSTIWVDKGVKGLIPNGKNKDGSLINTEYTTSKVLTINMSGNSQTIVSVSQNGTLTSSLHYAEQEEQPTTIQTLWYKPSENIMSRINNNGTLTKPLNTFIVATNYCTNGIVSNFQPKLPFRAVDYQEASGLGMPSNRYIDLTLGASSTNYIAPANGWYYLGKCATANGQYIDMYNTTSNYRFQTQSVGTAYCLITIPAKKGDIVKINYTVNGELNGFRFIYAQGEL